jgi:sugar phosphate permease
VWPRFYFGWWLVGAALLAQFVAAGMQAYIVGVFMVPMTTDLGWSRADFTLGLTVGQFVMGICGVFVGARIDRHGARPLMAAGVTLLGAAALAISFVQELWQWLLLRGLVLTIGSALLGNLVVNVTLSKWFVERRGRAIGFAAIGISLAGVVLPPLLTPVVDEFGWRAGWRVLALGAWLLIYPSLLVMRRAPEDYGLHPDGKSDEDVRAGRAQRAADDLANSFTRAEAMRTPALYLIAAAFGIAAAAMVTMLIQTIPYVTDSGYSRSTASFMLVVMALPAAVTKPGWGYLTERVHARYLSAGSFVLAGVSLAGVVLMMEAGSLPGMIACFFTLGIAFGGMLPLQETIWASYFGRRYLGSVRSVGLPLSLIFSGGAPLLASVYFDRVGNYDGAFLALAAIWSSAAAVILFARQPRAPARRALPARAIEAPARH